MITQKLITGDHQTSTHPSAAASVVYTEIGKNSVLFILFQKVRPTTTKFKEIEEIRAMGTAFTSRNYYLLTL